MTTLVDSHCHLDFPDFADELDAVVARGREAGVAAVLTICTHVSRFARVLAVAERFPDVVCTVGIHPHEAAHEREVDEDELARLARHPKVVGLGETGLDYHYQHSPREDQERSFRVHVRAARATGLPLVVHARAADADIARVLAEEHTRGPFTGVLHCFSAGRQLAETALELGFYISFSGVVTFKKADALREIAREVPLDRVLVETDAPYLAPVPKRGRRNEPAFVRHTAAELARVRGMDEDRLAKATTENFFRLFTKATVLRHRAAGPDR